MKVSELREELKHLRDWLKDVNPDTEVVVAQVAEGVQEVMVLDGLTLTPRAVEIFSDGRARIGISGVPANALVLYVE